VRRMQHHLLPSAYVCVALVQHPKAQDVPFIKQERRFTAGSIERSSDPCCSASTSYKLQYLATQHAC